MDVSLIIAKSLMLGSVAFLLWMFIKVLTPTLFLTKVGRGLSVAGVFVWVLVTGVAAGSGFLSDFSTIPPRMVFFLLPMMLVVTTLIAHPKLQNRIRSLSPLQLTMFQVFRLPIEIMLFILAVNGVAPQEMSVEGWNYDIIIGVTAPVMAWLYSRGKVSVAILKYWNVFGLITVSIVTITGILSIPTQFQMVFTEPTNTFIATLPFIWLASFAVPMAFLGHAFSLKALKQRL